METVTIAPEGLIDCMQFMGTMRTRHMCDPPSLRRRSLEIVKKEYLDHKWSRCNHRVKQVGDEFVRIWFVRGLWVPIIPWRGTQFLFAIIDENDD